MSTIYQARNTLTGQTFLPRNYYTHALMDFIDQPVLSLWTVDLLETPDASKSFESVFPEAIESPRETQTGMTDQERAWMLADHLEEEHQENMRRVFTEQSAEYECPN